MSNNSTNRVYPIFRYYLKNNLDDIMPFREFASRVLAGGYQELVSEYYNNDIDLLKHDLDDLGLKTGWL